MQQADSGFQILRSAQSADVEKAEKVKSVGAMPGYALQVSAGGGIILRDAQPQGAAGPQKINAPVSGCFLIVRPFEKAVRLFIIPGNTVSVKTERAQTVAAVFTVFPGFKSLSVIARGAGRVFFYAFSQLTGISRAEAGPLFAVIGGAAKPGERFFFSALQEIPGIKILIIGISVSGSETVYRGRLFRLRGDQAADAVLVIVFQIAAAQENTVLECFPEPVFAACGIFAREIPERVLTGKICPIRFLNQKKILPEKDVADGVLAERFPGGGFLPDCVERGLQIGRGKRLFQT